jgi:hypothetical protein
VQIYLLIKDLQQKYLYKKVKKGFGVYQNVLNLPPQL